ncbi:unnamed protein product [Strongylus vulgaris]|uniref:Uncharacterized protein n=1 Tax=Strongylus vulgaris TaxID=40348 RepID=A0A3P7JH36_STRVU|nr:unnamed protein product [Strongylus vulgaris]
MNHLTVPDSPQQQRLPRMWNELRKKSISELSLVFDMFRSSPSSSQQHLHPDRDRACQSTGNLPTSPKGRRRRRMQRTWKALSAANIARQYVLGKLAFHVDSLLTPDSLQIIAFRLHLGVNESSFITNLLFPLGKALGWKHLSTDIKLFYPFFLFSSPLLFIFLTI